MYKKNPSSGRKMLSIHKSRNQKSCIQITSALCYWLRSRKVQTIFTIAAFIFIGCQNSNHNTVAGELLSSALVTFAFNRQL